MLKSLPPSSGLIIHFGGPDTSSEYIVTFLLDQYRVMSNLFVSSAMSIKLILLFSEAGADLTKQSLLLPGCLLPTRKPTRTFTLERRGYTPPLSDIQI
jgi:hypothetical protein